jgi:hypothetical protein
VVQSQPVVHLLHVLSAMMLCLTMVQKQGSQGPWTESASETMSQNKSFLLLSCFSQVLCHSDGELINTIKTDTSGC